MANHTLRMGKRMFYTSQDGVQHPNSFWYLERVRELEITGQSLRLEFVAYHDAAAYDAGFLPIAGATKIYIRTGQQFLDAVAMLTLSTPQPISAEFLRLGWQVALDTKDTADPEQEGQSISFFEAAVDAL